MKKILLVAIMLSGMLVAQAASVASENIYGIINIPTMVGMNALGINLNPMPGETAAIENIILLDGLTAAATIGDADKLYIFNGIDYTTYWLDSSGATTVWNGVGGSPNVAPGNAMWIKTHTAGTIYQIGEIATGTTVDIPIETGNNFIANPFPADFDLASFDWSGVAVAEKFSIATADLIRTWDGSEYSMFYYIEAADYPEVTGWYNANTYDLVTEIPAGEGFWFFRRGNSLTSPITVPNPFDE